MKVGTRLAVCGALTLAASMAVPAVAGATTITPAGDYAKASLQSGTTAKFTIAGFLSVTCNQSVSAPSSPLGSNNKNQIPPAPGNSNPSGPVSLPVNPASFTNNGGACPTSLSGVTATTTTSGTWTLSGNWGSPITGSLTIPQAGAVTQTSNGCTITVAPNGPHTVSGTWTNGGSRTPSRLAVSNASVPVSVTGGFGCFGSSATFTATYDVTDVSNTSAVVTVAP